MFEPASSSDYADHSFAAPSRPWSLTLAVQLGALALVIALAFGPPLYSMIHAESGAKTFNADYSLHVGLIQTAIKDGSWQPHFLFQWVVWGLSGFRAGAASLGWAMFAVVLAAAFGKAALTFLFYQRTLGAQPSASASIPPSTAAFGLTLASLMLMPISSPGTVENMYLGLIAPNVWHNPTSLFAWPLMMALFFAGARCVDVPSPRAFAVVSGLLVLNVAAKPNSVIVFAPAFAVMCVARHRSWKALLWTTLALLPVLAALILQWRWAYAQSSRLATASTKIVFSPLEAWRQHTTSILGSCARSVAFPTAFVILHARRLRRSPLLGLAWATFLVGVAWVALAGESGDRMWHFNFSWGAHLASYILFIVTIAEWLRRDPEPLPPRRVLWRELVLALVLAAHVLSGIVYFFRIAIGRAYL
jgi:hypothetical protein